MDHLDAQIVRAVLGTETQLCFFKNVLSFDGKNILHIAPEWPLFRQLKAEPGYVGGDIQKRRNANSIVDVTSINFEQNHFDFLICNHVM